MAHLCCPFRGSSHVMLSGLHCKSSTRLQSSSLAHRIATTSMSSGALAGGAGLSASVKAESECPVQQPVSLPQSSPGSGKPAPAREDTRRQDEGISVVYRGFAFKVRGLGRGMSNCSRCAVVRSMG
jgi:hypothetical protein